MLNFFQTTGFKLESDFLVLIPDFGIIYVEVKRTDRPINLTKAAAQIGKIKDLIDIITLQCLGIKMVCAKVSLLSPCLATILQVVE